MRSLRVPLSAILGLGLKFSLIFKMTGNYSKMSINAQQEKLGAGKT
jgi:hypothetical protein